MNRRSPPWGAIEAFVTASRFASFKDAAGALGLSAPAFSRRIQALEAHVGTRLFDRAQPVPALTQAGRRYLARLAPAYEAMRAATDGLLPSAGGRPLRVAVTQSMAIGWLLPRLPQFQAQSGGLSVELRTRHESADLGGGAVDVALLYGDGQWPDLRVQPLFALQAFVVAAPRLATGQPPPTSPRALPQHRLLEPQRPRQLWKTWSALAGVPVDPAQPREQFDSMQVMYEATARGLGLAIGVRPLVDPFLADGRLVPVWPETVAPLPGACYVAALPAMHRTPAVQRFWRWIVREAESTVGGRPGAAPVGMQALQWPLQ
ncbi:LysR substrate-binding domain-containing protein [Aquabacterium sp.]|uniref:LysR substrate-binding domain-containing protein n=1 Tax=Aquabacterium sp. TaxID=1872578 RepID=UPI003784FFD2